MSMGSRYYIFRIASSEFSIFPDNRNCSCAFTKKGKVVERVIERVIERVVERVVEMVAGVISQLHMKGYRQ
jgi:hypothetical protein